MTEQEKIFQLKDELDKVRAELNVLYEISNAMRTSLKLDDVLYIILTGVTAHVGLGFNRAMLFLVNEHKAMIEGSMGIGPHTAEEANQIWKQIDKEKSNLDNLISNYKASSTAKDSKFNSLVTSMNFPLNEAEGGIIAQSILKDASINVSSETISRYENDPLLSKIHMEEFAVVPLKTKEKTIGAIVVDNLFNKEPVTHDDLRILVMFANQAGLAIENSRLYEETVLRSQINFLTKLWNHGYFQNKLEEEFKNAQENEYYLSLIMMDLDNFKELNDSLGHQVGDTVLNKTSKIIKEYCRKSDYPCRYGGEEFAIILPYTNKKEAYMIAERIRKTVEESTYLHKQAPINKKISISAGISCFPEDKTSDKATLLDMADKALYQAKHNGKNKTCFFSDC
ncbi:MAG: hypothetical protein COV72_08875 [Candidatus Omnitrophica bacterium CG11_big_fil_rev_8_21_14_0_20_42_13]|uniref:diguanylate cyclase n=1 Tax=Candidatus Ghiorseimicrobium undicola TaxID=1974746 RepID=A0A2H0LVM1_9BACT|nr:MAG: hypothetical protein COV72_08875 [Candidatus Omnitrophica bacterium CG11_big_fil_rev_8_21_14_0_20_42_13]